MGPIAVIIALVILVPLVIFLLARRAPGPGGDRGRQGVPLNVEEPAADEPTPGAGAVNRGHDAASRRVPPA